MAISEPPNNVTSHGPRHHDAAHIDTLIDEEISRLAPFSALIRTVTVVIVFAYRLYFIEKFLMSTKTYKEKYHKLSEDQRRSFVNYHVVGTCKLMLLITAIYSFLSIAFGKANPHTPFVPSARVTMGNVMVCCSHLFTVMYVFELFYRVNVSPISAAHHDAVIEFIMCVVWGAFDVIAELWPHLAMIMYRLLLPSDDISARAQHFHNLMSRIFFSVAIVEVVGTTLETIVVFWLFASLWDKRTLPFKVMTPILHLLFGCAQGWGAFVFWQLWKKEARKAGLMHFDLLARDELINEQAEVNGKRERECTITITEVA